jgi:hypothetical protein
MVFTYTKSSPLGYKHHENQGPGLVFAQWFDLTGPGMPGIK